MQITCGFCDASVSWKPGHTASPMNHLAPPGGGSGRLAVCPFQPLTRGLSGLWTARNSDRDIFLFMSPDTDRYAYCLPLSFVSTHRRIRLLGVITPVPSNPSPYDGMLLVRGVYNGYEWYHALPLFKLRLSLGADGYPSSLSPPLDLKSAHKTLSHAEGEDLLGERYPRLLGEDTHISRKERARTAKKIRWRRNKRARLAEQKRQEKLKSRDEEKYSEMVGREMERLLEKKSLEEEGKPAETDLCRLLSGVNIDR